MGLKSAECINELETKVNDKFGQIQIRSLFLIKHSMKNRFKGRKYIDRRNERKVVYK